MTQTLERRWSTNSISSLPPAKKIEILDGLNDDEAHRLTTDWHYLARDEQLAPPGDWRIWLFMGGRGSGKTRAGAEWIAEGIRSKRLLRVALIGATHHDARSVMIEGPSGLLAVSEGAKYEPSLRRVTWPGGAIASVLSADESDSIRGHQFDGAWADEFAKWSAPQDALDMILMSLRLGIDPKLMVTTTPRNIRPLLDLVASSDTTLTQSATQANHANLAANFLRAMEERYRGTRLGRQELDGDLIEDVENALWHRDWIERLRLRVAPECARVVVAVDPPASVRGDDCGIVVAGKTKDGAGIVLADRTIGGVTPDTWGARVIDAFEEFKADSIVAEANNGGDMVRTIITGRLADAPVKLVHATRDKQTRAMPVSALYERGQVHHAGVFAELEDEMCNYDGSGASPDRMDALVWALAELFPMTRIIEPRVHST